MLPSVLPSKPAVRDISSTKEDIEKAAKLESGGGLDANDAPFGFGGEKRAELGSAVGMLMWGLSLRHGWGVPKDEAQAFRWLKAAAEHAVVDLQKGAAYSGRDVVKVSYGVVFEGMW